MIRERRTPLMENLSPPEERASGQGRLLSEALYQNNEWDRELAEGWRSFPAP